MQVPRKWCHLYFNGRFEFRTSKTHKTDVSCKSSEFEKLTQKNSLTRKGIFTNLDGFKIFANVPFSYVKLYEKNDGDVADPARPIVLELCLQFPAKMETRDTGNGATSILMEDSNSGTSKTPKTDISCKANEFEKLSQKNSLNQFEKLNHKNALTYGKGIFPNLDDSKIFANIPFSYVKFYEKNDVDVADPIQSIVLELCHNFLQKWDAGTPEMVPPIF